MAEAASKTKANTQDVKSKKRKYVQSGDRVDDRDLPSKKKPKLDYQVDLTKAKNIILCSCMKYKEKTAGRDLELFFSEYIEEMMQMRKKNESKKEDEISTANDDDTKPSVTETVTAEAETAKTDSETKEEQQPKTEADAEKVADKDDDEDDDIQRKEADVTGTAVSVSVSDAVQHELNTLQERKTCEWIVGPSGLVIVNILEPSIQASALLAFIFAKCHPQRPSLSPHVFRLYPLNRTSFSRHADIVQLAETVIKAFDWKAIPADHSYAIVYKNRGNKQLKREQLYKDIAQFVPDHFKVDLKTPKTVVLLQTFGRTAGISIMTDGEYQKHNEFNLGKFVE